MHLVGLLRGHLQNDLALEAVQPLDDHLGGKRGAAMDFSTGVLIDRTGP